MNCSRITYSLWKSILTKIYAKSPFWLQQISLHQHMSDGYSPDLINQHVSSRITTFSTLNTKANHQTWFSASFTHLLFSGHIVLWHVLKSFFYVHFFFPQVVHFPTGFAFLLIHGDLHKSQNFLVWYCTFFTCFTQHVIDIFWST